MQESSIQGSTLVTLGVPSEGVGACLFVLWVWIDWFTNRDMHIEGIMAATTKTEIDVLAVPSGNAVSLGAFSSLL